VEDTLLDVRLRKASLDGLGELGQIVYTDNEQWNFSNIKAN
jgi:hypothetical protein